MQYRVGWEYVAFSHKVTVLPTQPYCLMSLWPIHTAVHDLACYKVRQRNPLGWGCLECLDFFFYISTCILYETVVNTLRAFGNSHFGWWDKYIPWPPQPWSDLLGISQNLWPPGCYHPLAAWAWLAGMWSRTREKLAWVHGLLLVVSLWLSWLSFFLRDVEMCACDVDPRMMFTTHMFSDGCIYLTLRQNIWLYCVTDWYTVVIAYGYNPTLAIGTVPCQLSTVKSNTRLPPRQTIHPSIHMLKIQWAFHPDSPKNYLATDTWKWLSTHCLASTHVCMWLVIFCAREHDSNFPHQSSSSIIIMFCSRKGLTINGVLHGGGLRLGRCLLGRHPFVFSQRLFMVRWTKNHR